MVPFEHLRSIRENATIKDIRTQNPGKGLIRPLSRY